MIGKIFENRYKIIEQLGTGGTAQVYKGFDTVLNRPVTIKVLREQCANDSEFVMRFKNEAQAVARLSHPNIVSIYDVVFNEDNHYLVMEYVEGCNLKQLINKQGALPLEEAILIEKQILSGLAHAHNHDVIHRDIKPHNILIDRNLRVKVTDFGIALNSSDITQTYSSDIVGSVHYMAPEQVKGGSAGQPSDIYSAGVVLYEMLTGKVPFEGDNAIGIAMQHLENEITPPHKINPAIPVELSAITMRALRKNPALRYKSCGEMLEALERADFGAKEVKFDWNSPPVPPRDGRYEQAAKKTTRTSQSHSVPNKQQKKSGINLKPFILAGVILCLLVAGGIIIAYGGGKNEISVPSVMGSDLKTATDTLTSLGMQVEVTRKNNDTVPLDQVISQSIPEGQNVKQGRVINLTVSDGPVMMLVPEVLGYTQREAELLIKNRNLNVKVSEVIDEKAKPGTVAKQSPEANDKLAAGSTVEIFISKGREILMPALTGLTKEQAEAKLSAVSLSLGEITEQESTEFVAGIVLTQSVAAESKILEGSTVNLVISKGPGPMASKARVTYTLPQSSVDNHKIRIVVTDDKGSHEEYSAAHSSGQTVVQDVPFYGEGTIKIYLDDEEVFSKQVP